MSPKKTKRKSSKPLSTLSRWLKRGGGKWLFVGSLILICIVAIGIYHAKIHDPNFEIRVPNKRTSRVEVGPNIHLKYYNGRTFSYSQHFNYLNDTHWAAASKVGLDHVMKDQADVNRHKNQLVMIETNDNYKVDELTHSVPYLTPNAAKVLDDICADFADILQRNNLPHYRPIVTSVLRTEESVRKLQQSGNRNASTNSVHCYGTTVDITYMRFDKWDESDDYMTEDNLKLVLGQALLNAQREGKIYVKHEVKQACFHITSRL